MILLAMFGGLWNLSLGSELGCGCPVLGFGVQVESCKIYVSVLLLSPQGSELLWNTK